MVTDILTNEKVTKEGLDEILRDVRLRCVTDRRHYIFHDKRDLVTVGKALKDKVFKHETKVPISRKLAKTHKSINKARKESEDMGNSEVETGEPKEIRIWKWKMKVSMKI